MQDYTASKNQSWDLGPTTLHFTNHALLLCQSGSILEGPRSGISKFQFGPRTKKILEVTFYVIFCEKHICAWVRLKR